MRALHQGRTYQANAARLNNIERWTGLVDSRKDGTDTEWSDRGVERIHLRVLRQAI